MAAGLKYAPFESPRSKVARAGEQIEELIPYIRKFFDTALRGGWEETEDGVHLRHVLRLTERPTQVANRISEVAGNLRSALDQMTWALAVQNGATSSTGVYFPVAEQPEGLDEKKIRKLSAADQEWILSLKPYRSGDPVLWRLNKLRNEVFHVENVEASAHVSGMKANILGSNLPPGTRIVVGSGFDKPIGPDGVVVSQIRKGMQVSDLEIAINFRFKDLDGLHGELIVDTLDSMFSRVRNVVEEAAARHSA